MKTRGGPGSAVPWVSTVRVVLACVSGSSGIDTYTRLLASALVGAGHDVLLLDRSHEPGRDVPGSVEIVALPPLRHRVRRLAGSFEALPLQRTVRRAAHGWNADVIHATTLSVAPSRWPSLVVNAWDPEPAVRERLRLARARGQRPWQEMLYAVSDARGCRRAAVVVATTRAVADSLASRHPHVVWLPAFVPDGEIVEPRRNGSATCVMVANYLDHPRKNLELAVAAVGVARARNPVIRLVLAGGWLSDERRSRLPAYCEPAGRLSRAEVARLLAEAGCCLLPSTWEEFGYAGLEALAAGTPLVCGPLPALAGLSGGVVVAKPLEPVPFAHAIERALQLGPFNFPAELRESAVVPALIDLYRNIP